MFLDLLITLAMVFTFLDTSRAAELIIYRTKLAAVDGVLDQGFNKFTTPMFGGFDGFDITEADPLRNSAIADGATELNSYAYNSLKKAIDVTSDAEYVEFDIATIPGVTNDTLNAT